MKNPAPLRIVVDNPPIRPMLLWSFVARLPLGMVFEALLFGVQQATGSLQLAGLVTAVAAGGTALGAPVQGRLLDRFSKKHVVSAFAAVQVATLLVLSAVTAAGTFPGMVLVALAAVVGFSIPSLSAMTRLVLKKATSAEDMNAAFSLDATTLELIFIIGPTIAAWGTVTWGPSVVFAASALLVTVGTGLFLWSARDGWFTSETTSDTGEKPTTRRIRPSRAVAWFVPSIVLSAIPLGLVEAGLIQLTVERGTSLTPVGIALSLLSVGSLVGGLVFGAIRWRARLSFQFVLLSLAHAVVIAVLILRPGFLLVAVIMVVTGLFVVPLLSLTSQLLDRLSPPEAWAESQSWGGAGNTAGSAVGITLGGVIAGTYGSFTGFVVAAMIAGVSILVAVPAFRSGQQVAPAATAELAEEPSA